MAATWSVVKKGQELAIFYHNEASGAFFDCGSTRADTMDLVLEWLALNADPGDLFVAFGKLIGYKSKQPQGWN